MSLVRAKRGEKLKEATLKKDRSLARAAGREAAALADLQARGVIELVEGVEEGSNVVLSPEDKLRKAVELLQGGEGGGCVLYWQEEHGLPDAYLGEMTPEEFLERGYALAGERWGSGVFRFRIYAGNKTQLLGNQRVRIKHHGPVAGAVGAVAPVAVAPAPDFAPFLQALTAQGDQLRALASIMALQLQAGNKDGTLRDRVSELAELQKLMQQGAPPQTNVLEVFTKGLEFGTRAAGDGEGGGGGSTMLGLLGELARTYLPAIMQAANAAPAVQVNPAIAPARALLPGAAPALEAPADDPIAELRVFIRQLVKHARADHDPETWADVILDTFTDADLQAYLAPADWFEQLAQIEPDIAQWRPWFNRVRSAVVEALTPEPARADNADGGGGQPEGAGVLSKQPAPVGGSPTAH